MAVSTCKWVVPGFSKLRQDVGFNLASPTFYGVSQPYSCEMNARYRPVELHAAWTMRLYPGGIDFQKTNGIGLVLYNVHNDYERIKVLVRVWFSRADHTYRTVDRSIERTFDGSTAGINALAAVRFDDMGTTTKLKQLGIITIACDGLMVNCEITTLETGRPLIALTPMCSLMAMYEDQTLSDMTIVVENQEYRVHKFILAANSPVFAAMFGHAVTETIMNRVEIKDYNKKTVDAFIKCIYTGSCPFKEFEENALQLLSFSEKYNVQHLKIICEKALARTVGLENAAELLQFADIHRANTLKESIFRYMVRNLQPVLLTPGWKEFIPSKTLLDEFLTYLAAYKG